MRDNYVTLDGKDEEIEESVQKSVELEPEREIIESGKVRINDLNFYIPPESIGITITEYDTTSFAMREAIPTTKKSGRKKILINLPITLDISSPTMGYNIISKLLIQIRKSPIATIENEKIRLEILGPGSDLSTNVAVIMEGITCSIDREFPSLLRCDLQMSWFNHLGYSNNVCYVGDPAKGEHIILNTPKSLYKEFYEYDTIASNGLLINDPSNFMRTDIMEIFYKEYAVRKEGTDETVESFVNKITSLEMEDTGMSADGVPQYLQRPIEETGGWVNAAKKMGFEKEDLVYYRWRKFEIPTAFVEDSGALILEDLSFSLQTNVAYLPLQGHAVPVPQFMGGSVSQLRALIFASAETDGSNQPSGTSQKLGQLQKIMDQVSDNRFKFAQYAREDFVMVRHPLAKLLKYDKYIERRSTIDSMYYEPATSGTIDFSYDDLLPVVSSNRISKTVEGLPYASRFQLDMKETRLSTRDDTVEVVVDEGQLSRDSLESSFQKTLEAIIETHGIVLSGNGFELTKKVREPTKGVANKIARAMTSLISIDPELKDLESMIKSDLFREDSSTLMRKLKKKYAMKSSNRGKGYANLGAVMSSSGNSDSVLRYKEEKKSKQAIVSFGQENGILNVETASAFTTELLQISAKSSQPWAKKYQMASVSLRSFNAVPKSETYKDLKIPPWRHSPTYYLQDFNFEAYYKDRAQRAAKTLAKETEDTLIETIYGDEAAAKRGEDILPVENGFAVAANGAAIEGIENAAIVHQPHEPEVRADVVSMAIGHASPMTNTLKMAYPTFKIYLKESDFLFQEPLSLADASGRQKRKGFTKRQDFSEYFDISNILDIRLIKDEKEAADLLVIRIAVKEKDLVNRTADDMKRQRESYSSKHADFMSRIEQKKEQGKLSFSEKELAKKGIREGTRIQCRLGYATDPNNLPKEFNGRIVSVMGRDILEVICLGNGSELIQVVKGLNKEERYSWNSNTPRLIAGVIEESPELVSFGNINYKTDLEFELSLPKFMGGKSALDNIFAPTLFDSYSEITTKALSGAGIGVSVGGAVVLLAPLAVMAGNLAATSSIAIIASAGASVVKVGAAVAASPLILAAAIGAAAIGVIYIGIEGTKMVKRWVMGSPFSIYNQTLWATLQELTLRHPGTICAVVPYDNRSTIYFGEPNQFYFYRGPTPFELGVASEDTFFNNTIRETYDEQVLGLSDVGLFSPISNAGIEERTSKQKESREKNKGNKKLTQDEVIGRMMKPFRQYHLITSEHDIVSNNIEVTSRGVSNSIQISYPDGSGLFGSNGNFDGSKGFSGYELSKEVKVDDDVDIAGIKPKVMTFHNAHNGGVPDMPERYAQSLLYKEIEHVYQGKITILGRSEIKPHDVCIIRDSYNGIYGPVGVAKVVQVINPRRGWVTEITPKMMVFPANSSGMFQLSMVCKGIGYWLSKDIDQFYTSRRPFLSDGMIAGNVDDRAEAVRQISHYWGGQTKIGLEGKEMGEIFPEYFQQRSDTSAPLPDEYQEESSNLPEWMTSPISRSAAGVAFGTGITLLAGRPLAGAGTGVINSSTGVASGGMNQVGQGIRNTTAASLKYGRRIARSSRAAFAAKGAVGTLKASASMGGSAVAGAGRLALLGTRTLISATGGLAFGIFLDSLFDRYISWSKYRQPILFYPLTRHGAPWYAAMDGFKNNSEMDHFGLIIDKIMQRKDAYGAIMSKVYNYYETL